MSVCMCVHAIMVAYCICVHVYMDLYMYMYGREGATHAYHGCIIHAVNDVALQDKRIWNHNVLTTRTYLFIKKCSVSSCYRKF